MARVTPVCLGFQNRNREVLLLLGKERHKRHFFYDKRASASKFILTTRARAKNSSAKLAKAKGATVSREEATREAREFQASLAAKEKRWLKPSTWFASKD